MVDEMNLRIRVLLIICGCALLPAVSQAQNARLEVETKQCIQGMLMHPVHANVSVFDASKVSGLLKMAKEFRESSNPTDEQGPERMLAIYSALRKKVETTPALARIKRMPGSKYVFNVPSVPQVAVFAFGESEDELTSFAEQQSSLAPSQINHVVLSFSTEEECKGAK